MKKIIPVAILLLLFFWGYFGYHKVVELNGNIKNLWKEIEPLIDEENDIVLQMIGYAEIEADTLDREAKNVANSLELWEKAGTGTNIAEKIAAESTVVSTFTYFISALQNDRTLANDKKLLSLKTQFNELDGPVVEKRKKYNKLVSEYNEKILGFPGRLAMRYEQLPQNIPSFELIPAANIQTTVVPSAPTELAAPAPVKEETAPEETAPIKIEVKPSAQAPEQATEPPVKAAESYVEPPSAIQPSLQGASGTLKPIPPTQIAPNPIEEAPQPPVTPRAPATPTP